MLVTMLLAAVIALPATSAAQDNSAIDEYTESLPSPGEETPSHEPDEGAGAGSGGSGGSGGEAQLPPSSSEALAGEGAAGEAAASLAQATAPEGAGTPAGGEDSKGSAGERSSDGGEAVTGVFDAVTGGSSDSDGLGIWLPVLLGATLLAAIAIGIVRRRREAATASQG
jgi:hypothetical protein